MLNLTSHLLADDECDPDYIGWPTFVVTIVTVLYVFYGFYIVTDVFLVSLKLTNPTECLHPRRHKL